MTAASPFAAVILAAGQGTRMKSALPKMLHEAAGRPLLEHVVNAVLPLGPERVVIVVGHGAEAVRAHFESGRFADAPLAFALQEQQLGTGHALLTALPELEGFEGDIMVLTGDAPLLTAETLRALRDGHQASGAGATLLYYTVEDPTGLGRLIRDERGALVRIVEEKDASDEERAVREINPGFFIFDRNVRELAGELGNDNAQGEYYLTDLPALYQARGLNVSTVEGLDETGLLVGVNNRVQLAQAERLLRDRIRRRWLLEGVTMQAPETVFIDDTVELASDVLLEPGVILRGNTRLGRGTRVGAYSVLEDVKTGPDTRIAPHTVLSGGERVGGGG